MVIELDELMKPWEGRRADSHNTRCGSLSRQSVAGRPWRAISLSVLLLTAAGAGRQAVAQTYTLVDLNPPGALSSSAIEVNSSGQVLINSSGRAFLWQSGTLTDLGLPGQSPSATHVNDAGQVVGLFYTGSPVVGHSFLWQNGVLQDLGTLGGSASRAIGIGQSGEVVGQMLMAGTNEPRAFLWQNGVVQDLTQANGIFRFAHRINPSGWVIGDGAPGTHAFLWRNGVVTDLGTLGGGFSTPNAINTAGQIVGGSTTVAGANWPNTGRAFLYSAGVMRDLGLLPGTDKSEAYDISNPGQVVGASGGRAFLYSGGVMRDLNALIPAGSGWLLRTANGINDYGQIVGAGLRNGIVVAFLLNPPPPPSPSGLSASALSSSQARLTWTDNSLIETAFALWRKRGTADWSRIAVLAPNTAQFTDSGLTPATSYTYRVRAIGLGGASDWTNEGAVLLPDVPPVAPTGLSAQAISSARIDLSWMDASSNETGFGIFRRVGSGDWVRIAVGFPNATGFSDYSASPNAPYTYRVRAFNNYGVSAWTNEVSATTPASP
jgi:probable HAF family extracellular repeat protein